MLKYDALHKSNLCSIEVTIDRTCLNLLKRILTEDDHPLTLRMNKVAQQSTTTFRFQPNKANKSAYQNSFVQKFVRVLRDGVADRYTNNSQQTSKQRTCPIAQIPPPSLKKAIEKISCLKCGLFFCKGAGMASHAKKCNGLPKPQINFATAV